jgi:hypothetical protein
MTNNLLPLTNLMYIFCISLRTNIISLYICKRVKDWKGFLLKCPVSNAGKRMVQNLSHHRTLKKNSLSFTMCIYFAQLWPAKYYLLLHGVLLFIFN